MAKRPAAARRPSSAAAIDPQEIRRVASTDLPRAIAMAEKAKAEGVSDPAVHSFVALGLKRQGRLEDAILELGRGLADNPHDARLMVEVGFCLLELGRRYEAARVFATAVKLAPDFPDAAFGFATTADQVGELEAAEAGFKRTLALSPGHADALLGLAGLAGRRRQWEEARSFAERALAIAPGHVDGLMNLARSDLGLGRLEEAQVRLKDILGKPDLLPQSRITAELLLGDALDAAGRYQDAFEAYAAGKSVTREAFAERFDGPEIPSIHEGVQQILAEFEASPPEGWSRPARTNALGPARQHAFLVGFMRTGTTLMGQVLAAHPDIVALDERPLMIDAEAEFLTRPGGVSRLGAVVGDLLDPLRQIYWKRVREFGVEPDGKVFVDKHPLSSFRLPLISKMFPFAKVIFAVRDPRDVVLSCFRRNFNVNPATYEFVSIERAAGLYDRVMHAAEVYLARLPIDSYRLRYEDLVADFEETSRGLCEFLGVEWTETMRDFAAQAGGRLVATPSSTQVLRGLYAEGAGQWRNYESALEPAMEILQPWIEKFGYEP